MIEVPQAAIDLAKRFEGFCRVPKSDPDRAYPYVCPAGFWTIGYGHLCDSKHPPITMEEGEAYIAADMADALSSTVRPVITYWFMALYCAAKTAAFAAALSAGADWGTAVLHAWTEADQALWAGVLNFWFLGRVFDKVRP